MTNIIFNRETLQVAGMGRDPLPFEVEVKNVDVTGLTKEVTYLEKEEKKTEDGKILYFLPQEPIVNEVEEEIQIETTEDTGNPIMIRVEKQVPLLDENGHPVKYEKMIMGEVTEDTGNPVMITDEETGEQIQKVDENGNKLFYGLVETGEFIDCFTTEIVEEQKKDENGNPLFYKTETTTREEIVEQPPLEITEDDERFVDELEKVFVDVEKKKIVKFEENQEEFNYNDIVAHKENHLTNNTLYKNAKLIEDFNDELVDSNCNVGLGFVNLPSNGYCVVKFNLVKNVSIVDVYIESSDNVEVQISADGNEFITKTANATILNQETNSVYVKVINHSDKPIDVNSLGILY